jgi:hypothetical protein
MGLRLNFALKLTPDTLKFSDNLLLRRIANKECTGFFCFLLEYHAQKVFESEHKKSLAHDF